MSGSQDGSVGTRKVADETSAARSSGASVRSLMNSLDFWTSRTLLVRGYITALSIVACLACVAYVMLSVVIHEQEAHSTLVNVSGRQRMLSQRIALMATRLSQPGTDDPEQLQATLSEAVALMQQSHEGLTRGSGEMELPASMSEAVRRLYFSAPTELDSRVNRYIEHATVLAQPLRHPVPPDHPSLVYILSHGPNDLLLDLDRMVKRYETEAREEITALRNLETGVLILTLLILVLEALLIFRPMITRVLRAEQAKDDLVATVSHELRSPLTSLQGSLTLLADGAVGELPPTAEQLINIASRSSGRLVRLVNDVLDTQTLESGQVQFRLEPVDLNVLVEEAMSELEGTAQPAGVELLLEVEEVPALVDTDRDRMMQVMANLLSNAIKFSPRGSQVRVGVEAKPGGYRVSIADEGSGVDPAIRSKVFERFVRSTKYAYKLGGTGLGLSISKDIVEMLGGSIGFESGKDRGTIFFFDHPS